MTESGSPEGADTDQPVERRWGLVIVAGHFMNVFIMVGTAKSIGILLHEIHVYFDVPMAVASLLMTVAGCIFALGAPLGTVLGEYFTARVVVMAGGVIVLVGISLCSLMLNVAYTIVLYGIGMGVANSVIYGNGLVLIGQYFNKHRSLATGLSLAGGSLGQFAIPPLLQYLLETYLLGGALLLLGGLYFHVTLFAALFRPLSYYEKTPTKIRMGSEDDFRRIDHEQENNELEDDSDLGVATTVSYIAEETSCRSSVCNDLVDDNGNIDHKMSNSVSKTTDNNIQRKTSVYMDKYIPGDVVNTGQPNEFITETRVKKLKHSKDIHHQPTRSEKCCKVMRKILDFSVLKNYVCIFYTIFSIISFFGHFNFVLILPSYAIDKGITDYNKAFLVSITGASDLVGRVFFGYLGDLGFIPRYMMQSLCLIFLGIDILIYIFASGYPWIASLSAVFGFLGGGYVTLIAVVLVDLAGLDLLAKTLAVALFTQGIAYASGQPLLGLVRDYTGSYDVAVYICSGCCLLSGVLLLFAPKVQVLQRNRS